MSAKKVLGFLVCRSAFTQRNVTSIMLVFVFFGIYVAAGGKVTTTLPRPEKSGLVNPGAPKERPNQETGESMPDLTSKESKGVLGILPTKEEVTRRRKINRRGRLFTPEEVRKANQKPIDEDGLIEGGDFANRREQWRLERSEKKPRDSLAAIEERLQIRRR